MRPEILTAAMSKVHIFVLMTLCRVVSRYRSLGEIMISIFTV